MEEWNKNFLSRSSSRIRIMRPRAYYHFPIETTTRLTLTVESILFQEQNDCRDSLNSNANRVYIHIYTYIYDA